MSILYTIRFITFLAVSIYFPYLAVWLSKHQLLDVRDIAFIVGFTVFFYRISSLGFVTLVRRYSARPLLIVTLFVNAAAYVGIAELTRLHVQQVSWWLLIMLFYASSISVANLLLNTLIGRLGNDLKRLQGYAYLNAAVNLSAGVGPFIGGYVLQFSSGFLPYLGVAMLLVAVVLSIWVPNIPPPAQTTLPQEETQQKRFYFWWLLIINALALVGYAQFYDIFPYFAKPVLADKTIGWLFLISGLTIGLLQVFITRFCARFSNNKNIIVSNILWALGLAALMTVHYHWLGIVIAGVILFSIAETIFLPIYRNLSITYHSPPNPSLAAAKLSFTWGLSESVFAFIGVYLVGHGLGVYSYFLGIIAALIIIAMLLIKPLPSS